MSALEIAQVGSATDVGMYVHESGTPGSPAVVFLHGAGASGRMWREHLAKLAGFHCLAPDLPGFGRSNQLPFLSRTVTADLVAELVATRVPARRAHVVGLSWGGGIAHTLLDRHPGLVDRAVIDGAGVLTWWGGGLILAGVTVVSPFLHTRPVTAFFSGIIGMDEVGRADLRASSPGRSGARSWRASGPGSPASRSAPRLRPCSSPGRRRRRSDRPTPRWPPSCRTRSRGSRLGWLTAGSPGSRSCTSGW